METPIKLTDNEIKLLYDLLLLDPDALGMGKQDQKTRRAVIKKFRDLNIPK